MWGQPIINHFGPTFKILNMVHMIWGRTAIRINKTEYNFINLFFRFGNIGPW